ncbi:MAG: hypothetical protein Q8L36_01675 [bacterium]|nr:hypothetical protein [bacterium]
MSKINKIVIWILVVVVVVLIGFLVFQNIFQGSSFYAVYLRTGDLYFGKLTRFPVFGLKDPYLLQVQNDPQNPLSIQKFENIFWGPEGYLRINRNEVVWMAQLNSEGQLAQVLKSNPDLLPTNQTGPAGINTQTQNVEE